MGSTTLRRMDLNAQMKTVEEYQRRKYQRTAKVRLTWRSKPKPGRTKGKDRRRDANQGQINRASDVFDITNNKDIHPLGLEGKFKGSRNLIQNAIYVARGD